MTAPTYRLAEAAQVLGVSDDTVRRWVEAGRLTVDRGTSRPMAVAGKELARLALELAADGDEQSMARSSSARNRFPGIVTRVDRDGVMAVVEIQAGPHRIVSIMTRDSADSLGLEPGVAASGVVKSTNVVIETEQ